jgi:alanine-glyoxylate transaminase/serine-glyoxylate transaminase/serine-pyruvate transaminase
MQQLIFQKMNAKYPAMAQQRPALREDKNIMQGRHFLHIPGPSPIPDRILRAIAMPIIDHRSAEFAALGKTVLEGSKAVFKTTQPVVIYPSSGTGAWEAAIVNTLSPGDTVLMAETGHFATLWKNIATRFGIEVEFMPGDWRRGADPAAIEARLAEDKARRIKAVMVVHNETSTGATSRVAEIHKAIDAAGHPALFMVDTISSLASVDYRHDEWQVDVTVSGSQKGLMLPPGLGFNAVSEKALAASKTNTLPRSFWDWQEMIKINASGFFPYTPATNLLYGLKEALAMLQEEGLDQVFSRHQRLASACRAAVKAWGLEVLCENPAEYSPVLTAVLMPPSHDADRFRKIALEKFNISLGSGLGKVAGKVFRIGHLGECNELALLGALSGVEMGLAAAGVPHRSGGVSAAMADLEGREPGNEAKVAAVA